MCLHISVGCIRSWSRNNSGLTAAWKPRTSRRRGSKRRGKNLQQRYNTPSASLPISHHQDSNIFHLAWWTKSIKMSNYPRIILMMNCSQYLIMSSKKNQQNLNIEALTVQKKTFSILLSPILFTPTEVIINVHNTLFSLGRTHTTTLYSLWIATWLRGSMLT